MIKIVTAPEPFPLPGRPVRRLVASCLKTVYMRGETKSLFDTIQAFLKLLAETKPPAKESSRMCVNLLYTINVFLIFAQSGNILHRRAHGDLRVSGVFGCTQRRRFLA